MATNKPAILFWIFYVLFLAACAPTRDPAGLALRHGRLPDFNAPESLTVDLDVRVNEKGAPPFSARLYIQPYHRYRLDVLGFGSQVVASYLWDERHWILRLNEQHEKWEGTGDSLSLDVQGVSLHLPYIHALFGFLWGEPLPGFRERDDSVLIWNSDTLHWKVRGAPWQARLNHTTGVCLEAHSTTMALVYGPYRRFGDRVLPGSAEIFTDGESRLVLRVQKIQDHPAWKKDPFFQPIPSKSETHQ